MTAKDKRQSKAAASDANTPTPARPFVEVDYDLYAGYLENTDLTEDQKREFLQALWMIIVGFVELGFGVHPIQQACGKRPKNIDKPTVSTQNPLYSNHHKIIKKYMSAAACETQGAEEGVEH